MGEMKVATTKNIPNFSHYTELIFSYIALTTSQNRPNLNFKGEDACKLKTEDIHINASNR